MKVRETSLTGVKLIEPRRHVDERGFFYESWSRRRYIEAGIPASFVQDNVSSSDRGVLRGLHYQCPGGQGKLVQVLDGAVWDVAVDVRHGSPSFGRWVGCELSSENGRQLYIPPGFAHGFLVLSERALCAYKCTDYYAPESERCVVWDDPQIGIEWPLDPSRISAKDAAAPRLNEIGISDLPTFEKLAIRPSGQAYETTTV